MARRVFFSFHYQDVIDFRANVVRKNWVTKDREDAGFFDASIWEDAKKESDLALKRLINSEVQNTTVTVVLIGSDTYSRRWVRYEIIKSMAKGNKILGVHINGIRGKNGRTKVLGPNPFDYLSYQYSDDGKKICLYEGLNGKWEHYEDHPPITIPTADTQFRGKSYRFSSVFQVYDWVADDGNTNFPTWIESGQ